MGNYEKFRQKENEIYAERDLAIPSEPYIGNAQLDYALDWVCSNTLKLLDFGCGDGSIIFYCALRKVKDFIGVDLSDIAIKSAAKKAGLMKCGNYQFLQGGVESLQQIKSESLDALCFLIF